MQQVNANNFEISRIEEITIVLIRLIISITSTFLFFGIVLPIVYAMITGDVPVCTRDMEIGAAICIVVLLEYLFIFICMLHVVASGIHYFVHPFPPRLQFCYRIYRLIVTLIVSPIYLKIFITLINSIFISNK